MKKGTPSICLNALLLQNHLGGIGNYAYHLARLLCDTHPDWNISLLVHSGVAERFRDIPRLRVHVVDLSSRSMRLIFLHLIFPFRSGRYALLHSLGNMGLIFCRTPQIITIHDSYEHVSPERFGRIKRLMMRFLISTSGANARRIIVNSFSTREDVETYYPHLALKLSVIYMGNKFPVRSHSQINKNGDFLFVGTIEPGKNLPLVLKAFSRFYRKHGGKLKVVGAEGWKQSHIPDLIDSLEISNVIEFLGYVPNSQLCDLYEHSLALIQASTYEGFGLPVVEAMACGCPVIAARNSGLIESGGNSALFFETNDDEDLLRQMETVYNDLELRRRCIDSGFLHAAQFTWERTARETAKIYESLLAKGSQG
jgi:glycosyltransferase involved in cell wall biosynthesis